MRILFLLISFLPLFASNLLTYNIYERSDRVDIMLSFDEPYSGKIYQKKENGVIKLTLDELIYNENIEKNINSPILQKINIAGGDKETIISMFAQEEMEIIASKSADEFGLRIRIKNPKLSQIPYPQEKNEETKSAQSLFMEELAKKDDNLVSTKYITVIIIMTFLLIFLFVFKRMMLKMGSKGLTKKEDSWLFGNTKIKNFVDVVYQKPLDSQNNIMLIQYKNKKYLVLVGNSNVILDKFGEEKIDSETEFYELFNQNRQDLESFLSISKKESKEESKNIEKSNLLDDYKQRASKTLP